MSITLRKYIIPYIKMEWNYLLLAAVVIVGTIVWYNWDYIKMAHRVVTNKMKSDKPPSVVYGKNSRYIIVKYHDAGVDKEVYLPYNRLKLTSSIKRFKVEKGKKQEIKQDPAIEWLISKNDLDFEMIEEGDEKKVVVYDE